MVALDHSRLFFNYANGNIFEDLRLLTTSKFGERGLRMGTGGMWRAVAIICRSPVGGRKSSVEACMGEQNAGGISERASDGVR